MRKEDYIATVHRGRAFLEKIPEERCMKGIEAVISIKKIRNVNEDVIVKNEIRQQGAHHGHSA